MFSFLLFCTQVYCLIKKIFSLSHSTLLTAPISPSPNVALGGLRGGRLASWWTSGLHRSEADLSLTQRGSQNDRALSLVVEFCWFVVTGDGVLLNFLWGFVGLWWLVVGLLLILWWITMALSVGVVAMSSGCG